VALWKITPSIDEFNALRSNTMLGTLDIVVTEIGDDFIRGTMPVDARTHQPYGLLHGGASVTLAETLGSLAAMMCSDPNTERAVGIDINANHIRAVTSGRVTGTARPLHVGRMTQVWEIRIEDEKGKLVCISRLTTAIVPKQAIPSG
jgi:1,4-dihydroxy-2-naphthoyl-CoA hydrolase